MIGRPTLTTAPVRDNDLLDLYLSAVWLAESDVRDIIGALQAERDRASAAENADEVERLTDELAGARDDLAETRTERDKLRDQITRLKARSTAPDA